MQHVETIIVGGGPAGSTCARRLVQRGREVLILDKASFPRLKLCAGWVTQKAMRDLDMTPETYPRPILKLDIRTHVPKIPFGLNWLPTPGDNWSIRRVEFDAWLLQRSGAPVEMHDVREIRRENGRYLIDDTFSCDHLVGAGGTMCPVRRNIFGEQPGKSLQIATLEKEFHMPDREDVCRLYFFSRGLKGYAWCVPKGDGFVNVGIGGKSKYFKKSGTKIHDHFRAFLDDLVRTKRMKKDVAEEMKATGHPYFLFSYDGPLKKDNCFLIGDSAGLASIDLGEGIGPAVESGLLAADEITGEGTYSKDGITCYSFGGLTRFLMQRLYRPKGTLPAQSTLSVSSV
jgi:flavin-dependent dehydrogenase